MAVKMFNAAGAIPVSSSGGFNSANYEQKQKGKPSETLPAKSSVNWVMSTGRLLLEKSSTDPEKSKEAAEEMAQWKGRIDRMERVYSEYLSQKGSYNEEKGKVLDDSDPIAKSLSARIMSEAAIYNFMRDIEHYFSSLQKHLHQLIDNANDYFDSRLKTVGFLERFRLGKRDTETKVQDNSNTTTTTKTSELPKKWKTPVPMTLIGGVTGLLVAYSDLIAPLIAPLSKAARMLSKDPQMQDALEAMVRPAVDIFNFFFLAGLGYAYERAKQNKIKRLKEESAEEHRKLLAVEARLRSLVHKRMMLQVCKIKMDAGEIEDVKEYNPVYAKLYLKADENGKRAWDAFYRKEVAKVGVEMNEALRSDVVKKCVSRSKGAAQQDFYFEHLPMPGL